MGLKSEHWEEMGYMIVKSFTKSNKGNFRARQLNYGQLIFKIKWEAFPFH